MTSFNGKNRNIILGLLTQSYEDYRSARILFNNGELVSATFLSCTAIEKLLKAILMIYEINFPWIHNPYDLYIKLKNQTSFAAEINEEYLKSLYNIYKGRYIGHQEAGFSFVIFLHKCLAELDYSFDALALKVRFTPTDEITNWEFYTRETNEKKIIMNNYIINNWSKDQFVSKEQAVMEYKIQINFDTASRVYKPSEVVNDGKFIYEVRITRHSLDDTIFPAVE